MTRFSARSAYIVMVSQMRALIRNRASISFRLRSKSLETIKRGQGTLWARISKRLRWLLLAIPWFGVRSLFMKANSRLLYEVIMSTKRHGLQLRLKFQAISDIQRFTLPILPTNNNNTTTDRRASSIFAHHNIALWPIRMWQDYNSS